MKAIHVRRRFFCLWLPFLLMGLALYIGSYAFTLTFNGLSLLGIIITGLGVFAAAYDSGEES